MPPVRASLPRVVVVIAHARSGSTLLTTSMSHHPTIVMFGELFTAADAERRHAALGRRPYRDGDDPVSYLGKMLEREAYFGSRIVGFKLMYGHALCGPAANVWQWLATEPGVAVVHLRRKDALASLVSLRIAELTHVWALSPGAEAPHPTGPIVLSAAECVEHFEWLARRHEWVEHLFAARPKLDLWYERDLLHHFARTLRRVWAFLELDPGPHRVDLIRQAQAPLADQVANYLELKDHFGGTEWERYFPAGERVGDVVR